MEKKIGDYLHLYISSEIQIEYGYPDNKKIGILTGFRSGAGWEIWPHKETWVRVPKGERVIQAIVRDDLVKPILRPLSDMTNEEADHFAWLCMNSRHHLDEETKIDQDEIDTELVKWDNGTMLDGNVEIYIGIVCRCFEGALMINRDGSISLVDDEDKRNGLIDDIAFKVIWLIKQGFDLFGLITANLAIDKTEHR